MNESEAREILGDIEQLKRDIYRTQYVEDVRELAIMLIDFCNNYLMEKVPPPCEKNWHEVVRLGKATIKEAREQNSRG